jgi:hypothetical protein
MSISVFNGADSNDRTDTFLPGSNSDPQIIPGNSEFGNRYPRVFKLKVLRESDACAKPGELGKYLRRMGLTHTTLTCFRKQRAAGTLDASSPIQERAVPSPDRGEQARRLMELERENRKLRRQLEQAEAVIDIQKKVSRLLEISLDAPETRPSAGNRRNSS